MLRSLFRMLDRGAGVMTGAYGLLQPLEENTEAISAAFTSVRSSAVPF
jgi:hypothetical protein